MYITCNVNGTELAISREIQNQDGGIQIEIHIVPNPCPDPLPQGNVVEGTITPKRQFIRPPFFRNISAIR